VEREKSWDVQSKNYTWGNPTTEDQRFLIRKYVIWKRNNKIENKSQVRDIYILEKFSSKEAHIETSAIIPEFVSSRPSGQERLE
jgi:hypothetical protein